MTYSIIANNKLKDKKILYNFRREMVERYYEIKSYRKTACEFGVNVKTVMKWVKRYQRMGLAGLIDLPRSPKLIRNKLSPEKTELIIKLREITGFGAKRLKQEFNLPMSSGAIYRVLKENGLTKRVKRKYQKKRDLRKEKERLKPFEVIQMDVKYLDDIPEFFKYYCKYKLPRYQITARDVRSGTLFYFYTYEKSVTSTIISVKLLFEHLSKHGINPEKITIQVDNGSEFSGIRIHHDRGFKKYVEKNWNAKVKYIPPHYPNANADVESSHRLIEDEFYSRESFSSIKDFLNKASAYQFYFNFLRKNSYKQFKTPLNILENYKISPTTALLPPVIVDNLINKNHISHTHKLYHHVPELPEFLTPILLTYSVYHVNKLYKKASK